eukprot:4837121-Pyramimonas_sp.AAC.2
MPAYLGRASLHPIIEHCDRWECSWFCNNRGILLTDGSKEYTLDKFKSTAAQSRTHKRVSNVGAPLNTTESPGRRQRCHTASASSSMTNTYVPSTSPLAYRWEHPDGNALSIPR